MVRERLEIHNQAVPKEARRAVNRWKGLEPGVLPPGRSETQVPEGSRSTLQFVKSERGRSNQVNEDVT